MEDRHEQAILRNQEAQTPLVLYSRSTDNCRTFGGNPAPGTAPGRFVVLVPLTKDFSPLEFEGGSCRFPFLSSASPSPQRRGVLVILSSLLACLVFRQESNMFRGRTSRGAFCTLLLRVSKHSSRENSFLIAVMRPEEEVRKRRKSPR